CAQKKQDYCPMARDQQPKNYHNYKKLLYEQDNDNNIRTNTKKLLLETLEYETTNYKTEEIQNKLIQELLSKEITKKIWTSSPLANQINKRKIQDSGSPVNSATIDDTRKKMKTKMPNIF
ncbi:28539_t:CDS:2, partial [Gigaspora margarita]